MVDRTPDDIKIIAQFLAETTVATASWHDFKKQAFLLRRQLKTRGGFKLTRRLSVELAQE